MLKIIKAKHKRNHDAREFLDFYAFVEDFNYSRYERIKLVTPNGSYNGYLYFLEKADKDRIERYKSRFRNIKFFSTFKEYVPEIKRDAIFIANKTIN